MTKKKKDDDDIVRTPAGPIAKKKVKAVGPGKSVRRNPDGTLVIVDTEQSQRDEGSRMMTDDYILTPGGMRHRSLVHLVEKSAVVDGHGGHHRKLDASGKMLADFGLVPHRPAGRPLMPFNVAYPPKRIPSFGQGWITYGSWTNATGTPISLFSTKWVVPRAPSTQSGQLIYLFNGIQNSTMIYQPVLQWGSNGAFGGNFWCVASWYADGQGGQAFHSNDIRVNEGDVLTGIMTLTGQSPQGFSYNCEFQGIANSGLPIQNVQELTWCVQTLECYGITQCSDYPNTDKTQMYAINIEAGKTNPAVVWIANDPITDCGQHTLIFDDDSAGNGEVDLWYKPSPFWTAGSGTIAAGTSQDWWFAWGGSGDVGPQLIQAEPLNASAELATTVIAESMNAQGNLVYNATVKNNGPNTVNFQWRGGGR